MKLNRRQVGVLVSAFTGVVILAQPVLAQEQRQHGSHEHGIAELNVVIENVDIHMELRSPAMNIVGFEHAPSTDEHREAIHKANATLEGADQMFAFSGTSCRLVEAHAEMTAMNDHDGDHHDEHAKDDHHDDDHHDEHAKDDHHDDHHDEHAKDDHHDDDHHDEHAKDDHHDEDHHDEHAKAEHAKDDHHDDDDHHEHAKDGHHDEHEEETHSEFHVSYQFTCDDIGDLTAIQVKLFDAFPATEELETRIITPSQQLSKELTASSSQIDLK